MGAQWRSVGIAISVVVPLILGIGAQRFALAAFEPESAAQNDSSATIDGFVVRLGTTEPIPDAEVELMRVEGVPDAPLERTPAPVEIGPNLPALAARGRGGLNAVDAADARARNDALKHGRTAADGRFAFHNLKPGRYTLAAARKGSAYMPAEYGQRDPSGRGMAFLLAKGQAIHDVKLEMAPTGVIAGRVVDESGEPIGHATVMALAPYYKDGRRALSIVQIAQTGSHGEYRLYWLPPGRYYVAAKTEDLRRRAIPVSIDDPGSVELRETLSGPFVQRVVLPTGETMEETYAMVYFGGVTDAARAQPIELHSGETFGVADINLGMGRMPARHIRGVVTQSLTGKADDPAIDRHCVGTSLLVSVRAIPVQYSPDLVVSSAKCDENGAFDVEGLVPGKYILWAVDPMTGGVGIAEVEVGDADVNERKIAMIRTQGHPNGNGQVVFEGPSGASTRDMSKLRVQLTPSLRGSNTLGPITASVKANGEFSYGLAAERFMRIAVEGLPQDTYVKSIRVGATEILSAGSVIPYGAEFERIEIAIAADVGRAAGSAVDARSAPQANVIVVLVPDSPDSRATRPDLFKSTTTDSAGLFRFQGIPAGNYRLFAWEYAQDGIWHDPDFFRDYEHLGTALQVDAGSNNENIQLGVLALRR